MSDQELIKAIRELMQKYNEWRAKWIARFGTDEGFNEWFTSQVAK